MVWSQIHQMFVQSRGGVGECRNFHTASVDALDSTFVFVERDPRQRGPDFMVRRSSSNAVLDGAPYQAYLRTPVPLSALDRSLSHPYVPARKQ